MSEIVAVIDDTVTAAAPPYLYYQSTQRYSLTMDSLFSSLELLKEKVQDAVFALTSCVCQPSATIKVNGRSFKIVKILGEGGFSFVYLAQDEQSGVSARQILALPVRV